MTVALIATAVFFSICFVLSLLLSLIIVTVCAPSLASSYHYHWSIINGSAFSISLIYHSDLFYSDLMTAGKKLSQQMKLQLLSNRCTRTAKCTIGLVRQSANKKQNWPSLRVFLLSMLTIVFKTLCLLAPDRKARHSILLLGLFYRPIIIAPIITIFWFNDGADPAATGFMLSPLTPACKCVWERQKS